MISSAMNTAVSGLEAASRRIATNTNNIVNQNTTLTTDGQGNVTNQPYAPVDTSQVTGANGVVLTQDRPRDPSSVNVYDPSNPAADANGITRYPNISAEREIVNMQIATYDYKANLNVIRSESKKIGDLLDILS